MRDAAVQEGVRAELPDPPALEHGLGRQPEVIDDDGEEHRDHEHRDVRDDDPLHRIGDRPRPE